MADLAVAVAGAGPPLVLLHGGGPGCSSPGDFAAVLPSFARHRTTYAIDLPGYGDSPAADGDRADALASTLDGHGIAGADLVCQSLGSLVALTVAARRPDLVRRLVLTGTQPVPGPESVLDLGPRLRRALYATGAATPAGMRALIAEAEWHRPGFGDDHVARRVAYANRHRPIVPAVPPAPHDLSALLPSVTAPALLLWGAADAFCSPRYALHLAALLPDAETHVIPAAGHHVQSERPERYARAALAFLLGDSA